MSSDIGRALTPTMENGARLKSSSGRPRASLLSPSMPKTDITAQATSRTLRNFFLLLFLLSFTGPRLNAQIPVPNPPPPPPPPGSAQAAAQNEQSKHLKSIVDLVVLHATVVDSKGQFVPGLTQDNFHVYEDKVEQKISVFSAEDVPVTMGLVIDNSASMKDKRPQENAAALSFVRTSNAADEIFVVNFNDEYYLDLDEDFTSNQQELHEALEKIDTRGSTALYDATVASLDHLKKGHKDKRVLLVITDGDDDASSKSFPYTVKGEG